MTIVWSDRAIDRLIAIHDFIAQDSPTHAISVVEGVLGRAEQLRAFPESGRIVPEYERIDVREIIEYPYRLLYRITGDRIEIVNVLHLRQQL
jgi:plasmid stabilization system protein ParE